MKTSDLIQLLDISPNMPLRMEYLPASFVQSGSEIQSILSVSKQNTISKEFNETHIVLNENKTDTVVNKLFTKDVLKLLEKNSIDPNSIVKVKYGNESFKTALLDISEIEVYDRSMTLKLFFTNNPETSRQGELEKKEKKEKKESRKHFTLFINWISKFRKKQPKSVPSWVASSQTD